MSNFHTSTTARAQAEDTQTFEFSSRAAVVELQAKRLKQRFAFGPETARAIANIVFNAGDRS
jgi:hypothetical protein